MSHNAAVFPAANGTEAAQQQQQPHPPRQTGGDLAMLTLWKQALVDAFVAKLDRIPDSAARNQTQTAPGLVPESLHHNRSQQ